MTCSFCVDLPTAIGEPSISINLLNLERRYFPQGQRNILRGVLMLKGLSGVGLPAFPHQQQPPKNLRLLNQ
jgi:hypothetical protein